MNRLNRSIVLAVLMSVCGVQYVSGFAQTDNADERDERLSSQSVVRAYVAAESAAHDNVERASNLTIPPAFKSVVALMLTRSATFRRQYARIAATPYLSVVIHSQSVVGARLPALTSIRRAGHGRLEAVVSIAACSRTVELLAHEIEHIIEQLDGVDLHAKSRLRASGVHRVSQAAVEAFETKRATATGQRVSREFFETPAAKGTP